MGIYVNKGDVAFKRALASEIYVDKTMILAELNKCIGTNDRFICQSRPRRFGKSYVGDLLCAYYSRGIDSRADFDGLRIADDPSFEEHLNKYNIIFIDINGLYCNDGDSMFAVLKKSINKELRACFPEADIDLDDSVASSVQNVYSATGQQFVFVIDEYDVLFRDDVSSALLQEYLRFLNGLFKNRSVIDAIALAYLTGILPIIKEKAQSKLNNFKEYSVLNAGPFAEYIGFAEEETHMLCERYNMSFDDCKLWYDGYKLDGGVSVLTPWSVVLAMENKKCRPYWSKTSHYDAVTDIFKYNPNIEVRDKLAALLRGDEVSVNVETFSNTVTDFRSADDILTYCIHLGYLGYNAHNGTCYIPNFEVRKEWGLIANNTPVLSDVARALATSSDLLRATIDCRADEVAKLLGEAHDAVMTSKGYNDENGFQSVLSYAYYYAQGPYVIVKEMPTGKGFADALFIPKYPSLGYPAMVVELKVDKTTDTAMDQIRDKRYGLDLQNYHGRLLMVAVSYDKRRKTHTCQIEQLDV